MRSGIDIKTDTGEIIIGSVNAELSNQRSFGSSWECCSYVTKM